MLSGCGGGTAKNLDRRFKGSLLPWGTWLKVAGDPEAEVSPGVLQVQSLTLSLATWTSMAGQ